MSRRSLGQFRLQGATTSRDEIDQLLHEERQRTRERGESYRKESYGSVGARKRLVNDDSSEDEAVLKGYTPLAKTPVAPQHWLPTRMLIAVWTTLTSVLTSITSVFTRGNARHRYPYTSRYAQAQDNKGIFSRAGSLLAAPFVYIYRAFKSLVTTETETITTGNNVGATNYHTHRTYNYNYNTGAGYARVQDKKGSWWPWIVGLLLLPLLGYGYYMRSPILPAVVSNTESNTVTRIETRIMENPELAKRLSLLEESIKNIENRMGEFNFKLDKVDNIELLVEAYSMQHLQQNLIQIFSINSNDGMSPIYEDMKAWFKKSFVEKDDLEALVRNIERNQPESKTEELTAGIDEVQMKKLVEEYMLGVEKRQREELLSRFNEYIRETRVESVTEKNIDVYAVKKIVAEMLAVYDADKTGMVDYAMESAGGQIVSTKCTELYQIKTKQYSVFNIPIWISSTSPRDALKPGSMPGECWAFQNFPGYLIVRTFAIVNVTGFSLEHMPKFLSADGKIESAPKNFSVWGLREELDANPHHFGDYMYDENSTAIQFFPVKHADMTDIGGKLYPVGYDLIELRIETNYGNPTYTCLYRFRVHGSPVTNIKPATDDFLMGSGDHSETVAGES